MVVVAEWAGGRLGVVALGVIWVGLSVSGIGRFQANSSGLGREKREERTGEGEDIAQLEKGWLLPGAGGSGLLQTYLRASGPSSAQ